MIDARPDIDCVVVDLSPGFFGFARAAVVALGSLAGYLDPPDDEFPPAMPEAFSLLPVLVTSEEVHDAFASLEAFFIMRDALTPLRIVLNRRRRDRAQLVARIDELFRRSNPTLVGAGSEHLQIVDETDELRDLFWKGSVAPPTGVAHALAGSSTSEASR